MKMVFLGVEAGGNVGRELFERAAAEVGGVLADSDGVHVRHHIIAVIAVGELGPVLDRSEIGAEGESSGRLDAAEYYLFLFHFHSSVSFYFLSPYSAASLAKPGMEFFIVSADTQ